MSLVQILNCGLISRLFILSTYCEQKQITQFLRLKTEFHRYILILKFKHVMIDIPNHITHFPTKIDY